MFEYYEEHMRIWRMKPAIKRRSQSGSFGTSDRVSFNWLWFKLHSSCCKSEACHSTPQFGDVPRVEANNVCRWFLAIYDGVWQRVLCEPFYRWCDVALSLVSGSLTLGTKYSSLRLITFGTFALADKLPDIPQLFPTLSTRCRRSFFVLLNI